MITPQNFLQACADFLVANYLVSYNEKADKMLRAIQDDLRITLMGLFHSSISHHAGPRM